MLVANFTSRIPNMGEHIAHVKFCELLKPFQTTYIKSHIKTKGNKQPIK